jgi:SAM-dependent methyltransferase
MQELFGDIKRMYGESFQKHGDSPTSLLTPKGRNSLRFRAIDPFLGNGPRSVFDYGCGLGYLCEYLKGQTGNLEYTGADIMPEFIQACRAKFPDSVFLQMEPQHPLKGAYDVVFSSGVFNLQTHCDPLQSKSYAFERVKSLFQIAKDVLICDFMSSLVDFQQPGAQHFSPAELSEFCYSNLGRRFQIRHDLLPYEITLIVWRDQAIKRPENVYEVDV